jgi:hypothetical protein
VAGDGLVDRWQHDRTDNGDDAAAQAEGGDPDGDYLAKQKAAGHAEATVEQTTATATVDKPAGDKADRQAEDEPGGDGNCQDQWRLGTARLGMTEASA